MANEELMSIDVPDQFEAESLEDLSQAFLDAQVLAGRIALMAEEGADIERIHRDTRSEVSILEDIFEGYEDETTFVYSGDGFVPSFDAANDQLATAFTHVDRIRGKFHGFILLDPRDISFLDSSDDEDDDDGDEIRTIYCDLRTGDQEGSAIGQLLTPKNSPRLYMEMLIKQQLNNEYCVGGLAVRSTHTYFYNIMDLLTTTVDHMDVNEQLNWVEESEIVAQMLESAVVVRNMTADAAFRRARKRTQIRAIDAVCDDLNSRLGLSRVSMIVMDIDKFYVSVAGSKKREVKRITLPEDCKELTIEPIRVDSLEIFDLAAGRIIRSEESMHDADAGLCIVANISDHTASELGLNTSVIWLPLGYHDASKFIVIPNDTSL